MPGNFNYPQVNYDYSGIVALGNGILGGLEDRSVANALKNFNGDFKAAATAMMRMGRVDDAVKLYTAGTLADYRNAQTEAAPLKALPDDLQLLNWAKENGYLGNGQPSRLGPPDKAEIDSAVAQADAEAAGSSPTGVPGMSVAGNLQNAPALLQQKLAPIQLQKQLEEEGKMTGQRAGMMEGIRSVSPSVQKLIDNIATTANTADKDTFENAMGPLQGGPDAETWTGALQQNLAQTSGALSNYLDQGMKNGFVDWNTGHIKEPGELPGGFTATLRSKINATSASLINIFQRYLRVPGIGQQSDKELKQLVDQAGDLTKAKTQADFNDRLSNIVTNMKALGFDVSLPETAPVTQVSKLQDRFSPEATPSDNVPGVRSVPTFNVDANTGAMTPTAPELSGNPRLDTEIAKGGFGKQPKQASPDDIAALKSNLRKYKPGSPEANRVIQMFDAMIGAPGSAEFYLTRGR